MSRASSVELDTPEDPLPGCLMLYETRLELLPHLPHALQQRPWRRLFSTSDDGCSLRTAYRLLQGQGSVLLLVQDRGRRCFGGFVAGASWEPHETQYQGNGESFLFSSWPHGFRAHHWGRADEMFCLASLECLALGGGAHFGLWLGPSLASGSTGSSSTYGDNPPLTEHDHSGGLTAAGVAAGGGACAFEILEVQAWGFEGV